MKRSLMILFLLTLPLFGAGCAGAGTGVTADRLPDVITEVDATTLPRAISEARRYGKDAVRVTGLEGASVTATVSGDTSVYYRVDSVVPIENPEAYVRDLDLGDMKVPVDIVGEGEMVVTFRHTGLSDGDVSTIIYEIFRQRIGIQSTKDWTIELL